MTIVSIDLFKSNNIPAVSIVDISPEMARLWLERNVGNRPASPAHIAKLEKAMRSGQWKMAGDPIRFSKTGKLIDGQHRLQAILNSGMTITCVVMRELDDEVFDVIDDGKQRVKSDVLHVSLGLPAKTCEILAVAAVLALDYEAGLFNFHGKSDKAAVLDFVKRNPSMIASAEVAQGIPRGAPCPKSYAAFFHFYAAKTNSVDAARFIERFMVGAVDGAGDNLLHLFKRCQTASRDRRPLSRRVILGSMIRIWNAEQRGKPIKHAGNAMVSQNDPFPTFI